MTRFDRQARIPGWNQDRLGRACVAVCGRDWLGALVVWGLASMGLGSILWLGRPRRETAGLANLLLAHPGPWDGCTITDYPFDVEYGPELAWALDGSPVDMLVACVEDPDEQAQCQRFAHERRIKLATGVTAGGGWFGGGALPVGRRGEQSPIVAMALAAVLIDVVRETLCPLAGGLWPPEGGLGFQSPRASRSTRALLVGIGGIGVYAAVALAAALGADLHLHIWDFDSVEESNLNRQGLFTRTHAWDRAPKASAARDVLARLFPRVRLSAEVRRLAPGDGNRLDRMLSRPAALLSAVDNAPTRLLLQALGADLGLPLIQGGTDTFAADCFTQGLNGPTLDDQMHGALSAAATREVPRSQPGGCAADPSYVVPGMMAGALMAHRLTLLEPHSQLPPIRWRSGCLPVEQRDLNHGLRLAADLIA
jgi:molybdopterin/thiamine biosynthesis adenylyltransferase